MAVLRIMRNFKLSSGNSTHLFDKMTEVHCLVDFLSVDLGNGGKMGSSDVKMMSKI